MEVLLFQLVKVCKILREIMLILLLMVIYLLMTI
nr:MAG TPA: hypothetical protein [Bacteriophage sp.]DAF14531.1 MAG TPA: hypothetical protein [Crassvirales sp.]